MLCETEGVALLHSTDMMKNRMDIAKTFYHCIIQSLQRVCHKSETVASAITQFKSLSRLFAWLAEIKSAC
jgi:hypothetical protein